MTNTLTPPHHALAQLGAEVTACTACPRLVAWREQVAREKRAAYRDQTYWGRPVPGFGDPQARLVILGLAPGAHGSNRTGRVFTGDDSGHFLYAALYRAGFASQPRSVSRDDGMVLTDCRILSPVRCAPPDNKPSPEEFRRCRPWFEAELALLPNRRVTLVQGHLAHAAFLRSLGLRLAEYPFAHGAEHQLPDGTWLLCSYHVSRQNTQTGRLTPAMFDAVLARARQLIEAA